MELKQLAPWNWFKNEQEAAGKSLPVVRRAPAGFYPSPLARFHDEFDQLFENMLQGFPLAHSTSGGGAMALPGNGWMKPSVDIAATEKAYTISAELPGVDEKQIDVELNGDSLIIRARKEQKKGEKKDNYYCVERSYGTFQRQLSLPEDADTEGIQADFKAGVLTLAVPRKPGKATAAKRIDVRVA